MQRGAPSGQNAQGGAFLIPFWAALMLLLALSACLPEPPPELTPTPTVSPLPSLAPTATTVWFPPTPTFTPYPTEIKLPTPVMDTGVGAILYEDDFQQAQNWPTVENSTGSVAYGKGELTLAVDALKGELSSLLPQKNFQNFYLTVDALPSLCQGGDAYGVLVRAASVYQAYRILVNCNGQVRLERQRPNGFAALQDWTLSGQVQPGSLLKIRLGVWAAGSELRIFINGVYQFSVHDLDYTSGQIGVFARADSDMPLTVSFSNLEVRAVDPARVPTLVPTPTISPTPANTRAPTATDAPVQ